MYIVVGAAFLGIIYLFYIFHRLGIIQSQIDQQIKQLEKTLRKDSISYMSDLEERVGELESLFLKQDVTKKVVVEVNKQMELVRERLDIHAAHHAERLGSSYTTVQAHIANLESRVADLERKIHTP